MSEILGKAIFYRFEGHEYPAAHWVELGRFATGDERDPKGLFRLADDVWPAWPYAKHGRRNDASRYTFHFAHLRSWLKLYVKRYCYEILLGSGGALMRSPVELPYQLSAADRYLTERGIHSLDALAAPAVFELLWDAHIVKPQGDSLEPERYTAAAVRRQRASRRFWKDLSTRFGSPRFVPPISPHNKKTAAEMGADESKLIPDAVTRQLTNRLALHRDGVKVLNRFDHLRLCVLLLVVGLGRRIEEILTARRGAGTYGPLERYPCRQGEGEPEDALWFRFHANKDGPSEWVYVSPEWEGLIIYCVCQLLRYGDEVRTFAAPDDCDLLILVSSWNWTATGFARKAIIPEEDQDFSRLGAHGGAQRLRRSGLSVKRKSTNKNHTVGITYRSFRDWINGGTRHKDPSRATVGVMREWNITSDGSEGGDVYHFRCHGARHTRQSALARHPEISLLTRQRDLNHTGPDLQLFYQHALNEQNKVLMSKVMENPLSGGGDWLRKLLGIEDSPLNEGTDQGGARLVGIMTPRQRKLLKNHPAYVEPNLVDVGICDDSGGPENCAPYRKSVKGGGKVTAARYENTARADDHGSEGRQSRSGRKESTNVERFEKPQRSAGTAPVSDEVLRRLKERRRQVEEGG